jgi:phytoene desaturase (3,4-didehydrolycopene-forming)
MVASARETIIKTVEKRLKINLGPHIIDEVINTPPSWRTSFNLDRGAILGLSHSFFNVLSFRPKTKHPSIKDLYFVGASTHPGTGVPIVLAGAKLVTDQVLKHLGLKDRIALQDRDQEGKKSAFNVSPLDVQQSNLFMQLLYLVLALLLTLGLFVVSKRS